MKNIFSIVLSLLFAGTSIYAHAESFKQRLMNNPEIAAGLFRLYPADSIPEGTPAPEGYRPFYLSHYGRHGSRWLVAPGDYEIIYAPFKKAEDMGALTPKGKMVYEKVKTAREQAAGLAGSLSPLGREQHQGIAERMYISYPDIFAKDADIDARATIIVRCIMSMQSFCERLKEKNPDLNISYEASMRSTSPLEYLFEAANEIDPGYIEFYSKGKYLDIANKILDEKMNYKEFLSSLFTQNIFDSDQAAIDFLYQLFYLAGDLQSVMPGESMWDIWTPEQLYQMAVAENFRCYAKRGPYHEGSKWNLEYAKRLLGDILNRCDDAVSGKGNDADLRFGHDINIMGLYPLMCLNGYETIYDDPVEIFEKWNTYDMTPMAANMQIVLYRPVNDNQAEPLVKFLINEREATLPIATDSFPYYKWSDARKHLQNRLDQKF